MCLSKQVSPQNAVCCFLLFSIFAERQYIWVCASYQLIMNSLHRGVLPATEGREKGMFHAPFAVDNISLGLSALQTTLWNMCPADVQLIVRSANRWSTRSITPLAKPPKALSQHLLQQLQGTLTAKEVAVPGSAGLAWAMGWSAGAFQI